MAHGSQLTSSSACASSTRLAASRKEASRFLLDDLIILLLRNPHGFARVELQQFARSKISTHLRDDIQDGGAAQIGENLHDSREDVVTHQDGNLVAPLGVHRIAASAGRRIVDHIIVHERSRVHEFERDSRLDSLVGHATAQSSRKQDKNRTQLFAALGMDIIKDLRKEQIVGLQCCGECLFVGTKLR